MRKLLPILTLAALALFNAGCSGGDASATKQEEDRFQNPSKTPPAGAGGIGGAPKGADAASARGMGAPPEAMQGK